MVRRPIGFAGAQACPSLALAAMSFEGQRQDYFDALEWVGGLMSATAPGQLDEPTPCEDFTVRDLMGHLIGTAHRSRGTAQDVSTRHIPHVVTDVADKDLAEAYVSISRDIRKLWQSVADGEQVRASWGLCTALEALRGFTVETVAHGWDLAVATGQPREAPGQIADRCLLFASAVVPDRLRGVMYAEPVTDAREDSPTTRLAHLLGHR
jgi:uncharacterized protein (TIGR03086 family)